MTWRRRPSAKVKIPFRVEQMADEFPDVCFDGLDKGEGILRDASVIRLLTTTQFLSHLRIRRPTVTSRLGTSCKVCLMRTRPSTWSMRARSSLGYVGYPHVVVSVSQSADVGLSCAPTRVWPHSTSWRALPLWRMEPLRCVRPRATPKCRAFPAHDALSELSWYIARTPWEWYPRRLHPGPRQEQRPVRCRSRHRLYGAYSQLTTTSTHRTSSFPSVHGVRMSVTAGLAARYAGTQRDLCAVRKTCFAKGGGQKTTSRLCASRRQGLALSEACVVDWQESRGAEEEMDTKPYMVLVFNCLCARRKPAEDGGEGDTTRLHTV
jgi:hypothetical protein